MILKNAGLYIFFAGCCIFLFSSGLLAQKDLEKNPYVIYKVTVDESVYTIKYRFKDHFGNFQNYELVLPFNYTNQAIEKFGIPNWLFEPYVDTEYNRKIRQNEMTKGLFMLDEDLIEVDKSAVIHYYSPHFFKPIAEMIVSSLADYGKDTRRNRIEMAIRFVQDIPYGIPEINDRERHFGGVIPPPEILVEGYGDCDSKVMLFAGILMYLIPGNDIVFLNQEDHVLAAIRENPEKGHTYVVFNGLEYLIAETSGPGKRMLGEKGNYFRKKFKVETIRFQAPDPLPFAVGTKAQKQIAESESAKDQLLVIKNSSKKGFRFQLSMDNEHWDTFYLNPNTFGNYIPDNNQQVYLRFRENGTNLKVYKIDVSNSYSFNWNNQIKKWELEIEDAPVVDYK